MKNVERGETSVPLVQPKPHMLKWKRMGQLWDCPRIEVINTFGMRVKVVNDKLIDLC
jgi:hypothetical protein